MTLNDLPTLNASLNAVAAVLLTIGWLAIRRKHVARHRAAMVGALIVSTLFLGSYLVYHAHAGSRPYQGTGPLRFVYFVILVSHIVLAAAIVPMVLMTVARAAKGHFDRHARLARVTLPLWIYVSITGVVIYLMLYY